jgi:hypothetical protein
MALNLAGREEEGAGSYPLINIWSKLMFTLSIKDSESPSLIVLEYQYD